MAPVATRQPIRPRSLRSRLQHSPLRPTTTLRVSPGFLLPVEPPVRHLPTASRLPGTGARQLRVHRLFRLGSPSTSPAPRCSLPCLACCETRRHFNPYPQTPASQLSISTSRRGCSERVVVPVVVVAVLAAVALVYWLFGFPPRQELSRGGTLSAWCSTTPTRPAPGDDRIILSFLLNHSFTSRVYHRAPSTYSPVIHDFGQSQGERGETKGSNLCFREKGIIS